MATVDGADGTTEMQTVTPVNKVDQTESNPAALGLLFFGGPTLHAHPYSSEIHTIA